MKPNDLNLLRAKEIVSLAAWGGGIIAVCGGGSFFVLLSWICTFVWVALDENWRRNRISFWTVFTFFTGPIGFLLYYRFRPSVPSVCSGCGSMMPSQWQPCPVCGYTILVIRWWRAIGRNYSILIDSLVHSPVDKAKETAKQLTIAFAAAGILSIILNPLLGKTFGLAIEVFSIASYWVMLAWWVYLDSAWRKMDGMPWAVLVLVTNVVGLVTYLVIRYPDPQMCSHCGRSVAIGLKYCPFCGLEIEKMCPHCQSPVKPGWQYCPVCSAKLALEEPVQPQSSQAGITISGSVLDTSESSPIAGAVVKIDSREDDICAITDALGRFELAGLDQRPYVLVASADGYVLQAKSYSPADDANKRICFTLDCSILS
ncbi:zinc ribbon domain-containing protein [bacterium]|nr:zinc ribbon domain-containing protein [bacterium]